MPRVHTRTGVREARTLQRERETYNIHEVVTERAHAVRDLRMAVQRAHTLDQVLGRWLADRGGDLEAAKECYPWNCRTVAEAEIVHMIPRSGWAWAVQHWFDGGLQRSIRDTLPNLPESVRRKLKADHGIE